MIIFRYLARNVIANTVGVSAILMLVVVSSRFVKYLAEAATGKLDASVLLAVIGFRLPGFLELVLPLAFFLSILLAYGQLYVDSEMTVLHACGFSEKKLLFHTLIVSVIVAALVAGLSLSVSPAGFSRVQELFNAQKQRGEVESLVPGRFYALRSDRGVTYAEGIGGNGQLQNVFLAQESSANGTVVMVAEQGGSQESESTGERYLVLKNGQRIQGIPGQADFQVTEFEVFGQRLEKVEPSSLYKDIDAVPTRQLLASTKPEYRAALLWRISIPIMVVVVSMMAVPLSRTNPRQGRFMKILPAVLLYVIYLVMLNGVRGTIEDGMTTGVVLMFGVHGLFLIIALLLIFGAGGWRAIRARS